MDHIAIHVPKNVRCNAFRLPGSRSIELSLLCPIASFRKDTTQKQRNLIKITEGSEEGQY